MVRRARFRAVGRAVAGLTGHRSVARLRVVKRKRAPDDYSTGSFKAGIAMILAILAAIALIWLAYSWALNQPGVPQP
jgi:hypothetical protein